MENFRDKLFNATNVTRTTNGAVTKRESGSKVLDLFGRGGSLRNATEEQARRLISQALGEDRALTVLTVFYLGDVRGGQGERNFFQYAVNYLAEVEVDLTRDLLELLPYYNRWDIILSLLGTKLEADMFTMVRHQLIRDIESEHPSLMAKWLPSINASSPATRHFAKMFVREFDMSNGEYRKTLAKLRQRIGIVETLLSQKRYDEINYSAVPSKAAFLYRNAFKTNDKERYEAFLSAVEKGNTKINAKVTAPHEIIKSFRQSGDDRTLNAIWDNLEDWVKGSDENVVQVVDVSASMRTRVGGDSDLQCMDVSIALGMYTSERQEGPWKDTVITFSANPETHYISGETPYARYRNLSRANWDGSTNLEAIFDLILGVALQNETPQEELPSKLIIYSDMQFNSAFRSEKINTTFINKMKAKYRAHGYKLPQVVFWNLAGNMEQIPVGANEEAVAVVSGFSPAALKFILGGEITTPYELMLNALNSERYLPVMEVLEKHVKK